MKNVTNLSNYETEIIFNLLDIDHSGEIEFDEFYLIFCILIACKVVNLYISKCNYYTIYNL